MAISGYIDPKFIPYIWTDNKRGSQCSVEVKIFTKTKQEIQLPCIMQPSKYLLTFSIKALEGALLEGLPVQSNQVDLAFFVGDHCKDAEPALGIQHLVVKQKKVQSTQSSLSAEFEFRVGDGFSAMKGGLLHIAAKINRSLVKFLVTHLAVFTNHGQISPSYKLALQENGQKKLKTCFWFSKATFISSEDVKLERQKAAETKLELAVPKEKKLLIPLIQTMEKALKELKDAALNDEEYDEVKARDIVSTMIAKIDPAFKVPEHISPELVCFPLVSLPFEFNNDEIDFL